MKGKITLLVLTTAITAVVARLLQSTTPQQEKEKEPTVTAVVLPEVTVAAMPAWRFRRLRGIPAPAIVDRRRLENLPAEQIRFALHQAYCGDRAPADALHARLRSKAERAVSPLRMSAVGALEDMYVLHPDADFGEDVIDV